jgi:glycosyltransferase involved in cell wall biosynthesis
VVATEVGAMNSVICEGKTGSVVADFSPPAFAKAIHDFLSKPRHAMESMESIRNSARLFNWSHVAKAMIEEYESMLADFNFSNMKVLDALPQAAQSGRTTIL